jgi:hypothetical protein
MRMRILGDSMFVKHKNVVVNLNSVREFMKLQFVSTAHEPKHEIVFFFSDTSHTYFEFDTEREKDDAFKEICARCAPLEL